MTYTPSTDEVRERFSRVDGFIFDMLVESNAFDRWLSAEEARIRADERRRIAEAINRARNKHWQAREVDHREKSSDRDYGIHDAFNAAARIAEEAE